MSRTRTIVNSFNSGELSPLVRGRIDQARYFNGLDTCNNWLPLIYGSARVRGGLKYAGAARYDNKACYLFPFTFSASASYILEFGDLYIRFWKYNATTGEPEQIVDGTPVQVTTTYTEAQVPNLQIRQSGAVLFIVHASHPPRKLTRTSDTVWTLAATTFTPPPTYEPQTNLAQTLGVGANTGNDIKFRAAAAVFLASDVGRAITSGAGRAVITALDNTTQVTVDILDDFAATITAGPATITTVGTTATSVAHGLSAGNYIVITNGAQDKQVRRVASVTDADIFEMDAAMPVDISVAATWNKVIALASGAWFLEGSPNTPCAASAAGPVKAIITLTLTAAGWRSGDVGKYVHILEGTAKITKYTSTTVVSAEVVAYLDDWTAAAPSALGGLWTLEGPTWTAARGYPSAITLGEQRVIYAGAAGESDTIRATATGDYYGFPPGTADDDALKYVLASDEVNIVRWLHFWNGLVCGTLGAEFTIHGGATDAPLTPTSVLVRPRTTFGCEAISPDRIGSSLLFTERGGRKVRQLEYDVATDAYRAADLTVFSEHLTKTSIFTRSTYQKTAYSVLWYVRADGTLCALTYDRQMEVLAWSRHSTATPGGTSTVISVASVPNPVLNRDDVWMSITRSINGATKRTIEVLDWDRFLDSSIKYSGAATATITGLSHLNGDVVSIRGKDASGVWRLYVNQTVTTNQVTGLSPTVTEAEVGYAFTATGTTPRLEKPGVESLQGRIKGIGQMVLRCYDTPVLKIGGVRYKGGGEGKGISAGYASNAVYVIPTGTSAIAPSGDDGEIELVAGGGFDRHGRVTFVQDLPIGGTVLLLAAEVDIGA